MNVPVQSWLTSQGLLVKPEFSAPWGICDFVGLKFEARRVRERIRLGQRRAIGPLLRVALLEYIPDADSSNYRSVTLRRLQREFADVMDPRRLSGELQRLVADRFVRFARRGAVQRLNGWTPLHNRIVAVELKLGRPQEALAQAASHLRFADESFVALPAPLAKRVASGTRAQLFHSTGVGVLAVNPHGCKVILRPGARRFRADPILQAHCVERFWRSVPRGTGA